MSYTAKRSQDTRRLYDMYDILGTNEKVIVCPLPQHHHQARPTPSFSIFYRGDVQTFHCHGSCGLTGDVIDLVGYMRIPGYNPSNPRHNDIATSMLEGEYRISIPKTPKRVKFNAMQWQSYLPIQESGLEYARSRGLRDDTITRFRLGQYKSSLAIPSFEGGVCVMVKFRNFGKGVRFWNAKGSRSSIFNIDKVSYAREPILFLKGEIPTMIADQMGYLACGLTAGERQNIDQWLPQLAFSSRVVVVGDNDKDPDTRKKMQEAIAEKADILRGVAVFPPEPYKDFDEWVLADLYASEEIDRWLNV